MSTKIMSLCMNSNSTESSTSGLEGDEITSEVKFERIIDKFMMKTRPRPKVIHGNPLWKQILSDHADTAWFAMNQEETWLPFGIDTKEWKYLNKEILPTLLLAVEETMNLAKRLKVEEGKFRAFNYMETLIHFMLNIHRKPNEPIKMIEDFDEIKEHLKKFPKPSIPKHKVWSRHKAATLIQKNVRGWLVRKRPEVFEMRQFWKVMREELKTRIGPAIPRPLVPRLSDILPSDREISSDTDGTIYNDEKKFFKWNRDEEEEAEKTNKLKMLSLAQKPGKHPKHPKSLWQREKSRFLEFGNLREATVQTEPFVYRTEIDRDKKNPFHQNKSGFGNKRALGPKIHKDKRKDKTVKFQQGTQKPEISKEDIDVAISFEDLKDRKNKKK